MEPHKAVSLPIREATTEPKAKLPEASRYGVKPLEGSEQIQAPPGKGRSLHFSMHPLQFAVRRDWSITSYSLEAKEQFYAELGTIGDDKHARTVDLKKLLENLEPAWAADLPKTVPAALQGDRIFLPWDVSRKAYGMGWSICVMCCAENLYSITLTPAMCPSGEAKLAESSLSFDGAGIQEALRELFLRSQQQEARFQFFVRHLPGAHFKQDGSYRFTLVNTALEELLGSEPVRELGAGGEWLDWVHPNDREEVSLNLSRCKKANLPTSCRFRLLLPGGDRVLHLMELRIPARGIDGSLNGYEGLWLDLTREELAQQQLQHSAWKDSLAQISGSLSHDFNNMLGGLLSLSELLIMNFPKDHENYETVSLIKSTVMQTCELSGRIISLNREERGRPQLCNLSDLVRDQLDLIRIVLPRDSTIEVDIPDEEFAVRMDTVSMRRILVNFATNARDALEYKGVVKLTMRKIDFGEYDSSCLVSNQCKREGEAVEFVFKDNGPGIPPELVNRIFSSYFSTKDCTNISGSGLGLYCLTEFARDNHFDYGVRTQLGKGTEMVLIFPVVSDHGSSAVELEDEFNLDHYFEEPPLAFYGVPNAATNAIVSGLKRRGVDSCELLDEAELGDWLLKQSGTPRTLLLAFAYHDYKKARQLCESLSLRVSGLQTILSLQGLNPEHFSDLIGRKIDSLITANAKPSASVDEILKHLSSVTK